MKTLAPLVSKPRPRHSLLRPVALKVMRRRFASAAFHEMGIHERIKLAGFGAHEHVTQLVESFCHEGHVCLAFDLHGRDLSHFLRAGRMPLSEVKEVTRQLLSGLAAMHEAGVIHTDVKPDNILYDRTQGVARLSDLGLSETSLAVGEMIATQDYAPPEALLGAPMASPVDLWALGCTVFEMLTGELLFDPWHACKVKYKEFSDDADEGAESAEAADTSPTREELDEAEEEAEQLAAGTQVGGKYRLVTKLGQGKFATVWRALPLHDTPIALPPKEEVLQAARAMRATLPALPPRARWNLYDVAQAYEHLLQMHELLGPAPESVMQGCWQKLFCSDGATLRFAPSIDRRPLVARLSMHLELHEAQAAASFLEALLRYDPRERLTSLEALNTSWLHTVV